MKPSEFSEIELDPPRNRAAFLRLFRNATSLLASDALNRATTFALYVLVARYLSVSEVGQLAVALTLFYVFQVVAVAGLKTLITREVAKTRKETGRYLVNGSVVVAITSLLTMLLAGLFVWAMGYARDTALLILLLTLGLFPYAMSAVCEAVFQAWERMHLIAYANAPANLLKLCLAFALLAQGYGVLRLVLLIVASYAAVAVAAWALMLRHIIVPRLTFDPWFSLGMLRATATFLGIDAIIAVWASAQIILLSVMASEAEVGLFNAAGQLLVPVALALQSIVLSVFPVMSRRFTGDFSSLKRASERLLEVLLIVSLPTTVGLFFLAAPTLAFLYGDGGFSAAAPALRIMVGTLIFRAPTSALGQVLLAGLKEKVTLRIVTVNTLVSFALGWALIGQFGFIGAATATLLTSLINFIQHYLPVIKLVPGINLLSLAWKPLLASLLMTGYLVSADTKPILLVTLFAGVIYIVAFLAVELWAAGGLRPFGAKFRFLWSR